MRGSAPESHAKSHSGWDSVEWKKDAVRFWSQSEHSTVLRVFGLRDMKVDTCFPEV